MKERYSPTIACTNAANAASRPKPIASASKRDDRPAGDDLAVVVVPDLGEDQRPRRDRQKHRDEGQTPDDAHRRAVELGGEGAMRIQEAGKRQLARRREVV